MAHGLMLMLMPHASWLMAHGLMLMPHASWLMAHGTLELERDVPNINRALNSVDLRLNQIPDEGKQQLRDAVEGKNTTLQL